MKLDTANFIKTIQEHIDENTTSVRNSIENSVTGVQLNNQASAASMYIPDLGDDAQNSALNGSPIKKLGLLPEIKGPVKSIKQLLI